MSSNRRRIRIFGTLAFRLTLWYGFVFVLLSIGSMGTVYWLVTSVLREATDREMINQMNTFSSVLGSKDVGALQRVMVLEAQAAGERKIFIRLLSLRGMAFSSSNMAYWRKVGVNQDAVSRLLAGEPQVFDTQRIPETGGDVRVLYGRIGPEVILQLGLLMEHSARLTAVLKKVYAIPLVGIMAAALGVGWFMARKALYGLESVTRTATRISGRELWRRVPVGHGAEEIDRLAGTFNQMLDRIEHLVTGIKEMSDNIAHDLKSPVTRIRGMAEVTLTTAGGVEEYRRMAAGTVEECDRLLEMIATMLLISRTEAGVEPLAVHPMDLPQWLADAADLFLPVAEDRGVKLIWRTPEKCPFFGDVRKLQRMLTNLLDNAIKYNDAGGWVFLSIEAMQPGCVEVFVTDGGPGISAEDLPRIFDRFYRGDRSRSRTGTGLGLSLAKAIAEAHGGTITVESEPGAGATFHVTLPLRRPPPSQ